MSFCRNVTLTIVDGGETIKGWMRQDALLAFPDNVDCSETIAGRVPTEAERALALGYQPVGSVPPVTATITTTATTATTLDGGSVKSIASLSGLMMLLSFAVLLF
jgi:hypothetical protein